MTMLEVVNRLQEKGKIVIYRIRSDGGILITQINGKTYTGAKGNAVARELVGVKISEARRVQLESIKPQFDKRRNRFLSPKERKKFQPNEDIKKQLRKVQKVWNKRFTKEEQLKVGKITLKKLREHIEKHGYADAYDYLNQQLRYATGLAYDKNIDILIEYIRYTANLIGGNEDLYKLADDIDANRHLIKENDIAKIYDILYQINDGVPPKEVARQVRVLIGL